MVYLILIFAFVLRLINLNQSLWHDESVNVMYAKNLDFWSFVSQYPLGDFHPPGYFAILWVWGHVFGFSEISVRMPSVIFGILTVWFAYLIGKELFSKKAGLLAALFLALAPLHIYYSQEARMYSFAAFAATTSFYFLLRLAGGSKLSFLGYALSTSLVFYSDYVAYFILPAQMFYIGLFKKSLIKKYFASLSLSMLFSLPVFLFFPQQFIYGQQMAGQVSGWAKVVGGATIKNALLLPVKTLVGRISLDNNLLYGLGVLLLALPYLSVLRLIRNRGVKLLLIWLIMPVVLVFAVSFFVPVFSYFRLLFVLPAFYLLVAVGVSELGKKAGMVVIASILLGEVVTSSIYLFNENFHREDWKGSTAYVAQNNNKDTAVLFENNEVLTGFKYYGNGLVEAFPGFTRIPARSETDLTDLNKILEGKSKIFLYEYLIDVTDPQRFLEDKLVRMGYSLRSVYNFRGVGFIKEYEY